MASFARSEAGRDDNDRSEVVVAPKREFDLFVGLSSIVSRKYFGAVAPRCTSTTSLPFGFEVAAERVLEYTSYGVVEYV